MAGDRTTGGLMIGVAGSYVDAVLGLTTPEVVSVAAVSVAGAAGDLTIAKSALEIGGTDTLDVGDLLVAVTGANSTTATWISKATFPVFALEGQNNTSASSAVLSRVVDGSEGADFTFTRSSTTAGAYLVIWRIRAGTYDPADPVFSTSFFAGSGDATLPSIAAVPNAQSLLVQTVARLVASTTETWTPPVSEYFDVTTATNNLQVAGGYEEVGAGATGTRFWDQTGTGAVRGAMFVVNPKP